jgi:hypothetical protein
MEKENPNVGIGLNSKKIDLNPSKNANKNLVKIAASEFEEEQQNVML